MRIGKKLYLKNRREWRAWLKKNFDKETEVWLVFPHVSSGKPRISYNDAVEEALCFGWIDSIVKSLDTQSSAQRFSVRKPSSNWSQPNKERLKLLLRQGKIHPSIKPVVTKVAKEPFVFPTDILATLKKNKTAWKHYQKFSPSYKRIRIAYIDGARKRPAEFRKRLKSFIAATEQNKRLGYGGVEKYY